MRAPHDQHCSHCATLRGAPKQDKQPAIPLRRLVVDKLKEHDIDVPVKAPEVLFTAAREAILTVNLTPDSLGAWLCSDQKVQKIRFSSQSFSRESQDEETKEENKTR